MADIVSGKMFVPTGLELQSEVARLSREAGELAKAGRHEAAATVWRQLDRLMPGNEAVAAGLGAALNAAGQYREARDWLARACHRYAANALLLRLLGHCLRKLDEMKAAIGALYLSIGIDDSNAQAHADLAAALFAEKEYGAALSHAAFSHNAGPTAANASVLAELLLDLDRGWDAIAMIDLAIAADVERPMMLLLRSHCLRLLGFDRNALETAEQALALEPQNDAVSLWTAMSRLVQGDFSPQTWALYDRRAMTLGLGNWPNPERLWVGQDLAHKTILVHAEQGFGDTINFFRFVPKLAEAGARVLVVTQGALRRLFEGVEGIDGLFCVGETLPHFDYYVPLLSLPRAFCTSVDAIPPPLPISVPRPAERSFMADGRLEVGLVWAGGTAFSDNRKRSIEPSALRVLRDVEGVRFHSLQFEASELPFAGITDLLRGVGDFADTAQRIAELDLVISVDTSIAHLAGTMGKPVWMLSRLNNCWRWLLDREDTPWYPSMRIYRQPRYNDWQSVIARVRDDLRVLAATSKAALPEAGAAMPREVAPAF